MGRAASGWLEGDAGELDELRFHWGDAYDIAFAGGVFTATRRDGRGGSLADPLREGLRLRILADYAAMPVPRDPPGGSAKTIPESWPGLAPP